MNKVTAKCRVVLILLLGLMVISTPLQAQLSPGDLVEAHSELEGLLNCTKCHTLGKGIAEEKCLSCHKLLNHRIKNGQGYHASFEVKGKICISCHSDHHGRTFDIIRFDEQAFEHDLTGYPLKGAHAQIDCKSCHNPDFILNEEIRDKEFTFLGLDTECISCHSDNHKGTLSPNCSECHGYEAFKPATEFSHDHTNFPLIGKHKEIDCIECHRVEADQGNMFQHFAGILFTNCSDCHDDVHNGRFGQKCTECHTEESFQDFVGMNNFDHNKTQFPLKGAHRRVNCASCHQNGTSNKGLFQEYVNKEIISCAFCHDDVHDSKFGKDCESCHSEQSFSYSQGMVAFDHEKTDFSLKGKHLEIDCNSCHSTSSMVETIIHNTCISCHEDYHENEFVASNGVVKDCQNCHTVQGFSGSTFTIDNHALTNFPLEGAHLATPCFACHKTNDRWHFKDLGTRCVACHEDIHDDLLAEKFYPDQACNQCHSVQRWNDITFDHSRTDFHLEGMHETTDCILCHIPESTESSPVFQGWGQDCVSCHENIHRDQFEMNGSTDCLRCHGFENWSASKFDHSQTQFVLEGAHLSLACVECHQPDQSSEVIYIKYKIDDFRCVACHQ